jgi:hypothetical protein
MPLHRPKGHRPIESFAPALTLKLPEGRAPGAVRMRPIQPSNYYFLCFAIQSIRPLNKGKSRRLFHLPFTPLRRCDNSFSHQR